MLNLKGLFQQLFSTQTEPLIAAFQPARLSNGSVRINPEQEAIVTQTISPRRSGQVEYQGSWWTARCYEEVTLLPGDVVYVVARQHVLTLYVRPHPFARSAQNLPKTSAKNAFCTVVGER
jgi:NfeD-like C-terminal, partner-binding